MKRKQFALVLALLLTCAVWAAFGGYLKTHLPDELEQYAQEEMIALPFVLFRDGKLRQVFLASDVTLPVEPDVTVTQQMTTVPEMTVIPQMTREETAAPQETTQAMDPTAFSRPVYGVDESYFDDTLFIGDSRLCGMQTYARLGQADYFCDVGATVFDLWSREGEDIHFSKTKLEPLLENRRYGKIYLTLGINECWSTLEDFEAQYCAVVEKIRCLQPDAVLVIQSIMTVSRAYAEDQAYFSPENIAPRNAFLATLADDETIFFLDINELTADSEGYLREELSSDGCHLYAKYNADWAEWLCRCAPLI